MHVESTSGALVHRRLGRRVNEFVGLVRLNPEPLALLGSPSWRMLVEVAARRWSVSAEEVLGRSQDSLVAAARHHAMWLMRSHMGASYPAIGRRFNRDHSTVRTGIRHHLDRMAGIRPKPFVWTVDSMRQFERMLLEGQTLQQARRAMGINPTDLLRCPRRRRLGVVAHDQAVRRRWSERQTIRWAA